MKIKLSFAFAVLALSLAMQPLAAMPDKCASFCAVVFCVPNQTCGLYINSSGQAVCGCHEASFGR